MFGTDYYIGFSTAVTRSVEFINALRTPAGSHEPIAVVELFGRNSGETALISAYLADVDRVIISEVPFDIERLAKLLVGDKRDIECLTVFAGSAIISLLFRMMIPYAPPAALRTCSGGSCAYAAPDTSHHLWHIDMFLPQLCLLRPILQEHMRQPLYGTRRLVAALRRRYARSSLARLASKFTPFSALPILKCFLTIWQRAITWTPTRSATDCSMLGWRACMIQQR